ncbi:hypothetical protein F2P81_021804 [Scophthalmus maximus]|uniref:Gypsy retrotransposon integrase-like protein 1 n=1 Tax=Scophthalmus maximus TaxID=52904 RepID=A0A6A4RSD3_SCOMX|nr:hypothetical protein F2P81_021804 [Scophthalmus maximus]
MFMETLPPDTRDRYHTLRKALREEYSPFTDEASATLGAFAIMQKKHESPRDYYRRLRNAYFQGRNAPGLEEDHAFKSLFLPNLHECLRYKVTMHCRTGGLTMQEIKKYAQLAWETRMRPSRGRESDARVLGIETSGNADLALEGNEVIRARMDVKNDSITRHEKLQSEAICSATLGTGGDMVVYALVAQPGDASSTSTEACSPAEQHLSTFESEIDQQLAKADVLSTQEQRDALRKLFHDFQHIFSKDSQDCGVTDLHTVRIPTDPNAQPTFVRQYRIPLAAYESIQEILDKLLQKQIIRECNSTCNSPIWPVLKPTGKWRLTIDYRPLNKQVPLSHWPMIHLDQELAKVSYWPTMTRDVKAYVKGCLVCCQFQPSRLLNRAPLQNRAPPGADGHSVRPTLYVTDLHDHLRVKFAWTQENLEASVKGSKAYYDRKASNHEYQVGDKVFYFSFATPVGISKKFLPRWSGPFEVVGKLSPVAYRIRTSKPSQTPAYKWVHVNQIKPFVPFSPPERPLWIFGVLLSLRVTLSLDMVEPGPPSGIALQGIPGLLITHCDLYTQRIYVRLDPWAVYRRHFRRPPQLTEGRPSGTQTQDTMEHARQTTIHTLEQLKKFLVTEKDLSGKKRPKRFLGGLLVAASAIGSLFSIGLSAAELDEEMPEIQRSLQTQQKYLQGMGSPLAGRAEILTLCITKNTHKNPGIPVEARCDTFFKRCLQKQDKGIPSCFIDRRLLFLRRPDNSSAVND